LGQRSGWLLPHAAYAALAPQNEARRAAYRELFREVLPDEMLERIRIASNGNFAFGNEEFSHAAAKMQGCSVIPGAGGRPTKRKGKNGAKIVLCPRF
jgi:putative transposase